MQKNTVSNPLTSPTVPRWSPTQATTGESWGDGPEFQNLVRLWLECFPSENTRKAYSYFLGKFIRKAGASPLTLSSFWFDEYVKAELGRKAKVNTIKGYLNCLSSFYGFVESKFPSFKNPIQKVKVKLPETIGRQVINIRKRALPEKTIKGLLKKFSTEEKKSGREPLAFFLFRMLINTGARISELLSLEIYDPQKDDGEYINFVRLDEDEAYVLLLGKAEKPREFYLSPEVTKYLKNHDLKPGQRIFLNSRGAPLTRFGAYHLLKEIEKNYLGGYEIFKFSPHSIRHSYITEQVRANQDSLNIAKTVGNSRSVIEKYYVSMPKNINEKVSYI